MDWTITGPVGRATVPGVPAAFLFLSQQQKHMMKATMATKKSDPTTAPAMAPPELHDERNNSTRDKESSISVTLFELAEYIG